MKAVKRGSRFAAIFFGVSLASALLSPSRVLGSEYGRLSGIVIDGHGNPLMGVTVLIIGPVLIPTAGAADQEERVITNAKGVFAAGDLVPGWYSLQLFSPTRLPARQSGIRVEAGETSTLRFVLADFFAPLRFQVPSNNVSPLNDDWKWVLRTSAATRPILRYRREVAVASVEKRSARPLPASQRLLGVVPGSSRRDPLASDPGMGSVLAYLRALSQDSDLLAVGSMAATGNRTSSVGVAFRRGLAEGEPEEISVVVHQLGYASGAPLPGGGQLSDSYAQGVVASFVRTRYLYPHVTFTAGVDVNYLNAFRGAATAQPRVKLSYRLSDGSNVAVQFGAAPSDGAGTLLDRVAELNSFPRVTLRAYRPEIERVNHTEVSFDSRLNKSARIQVAAYGDWVKNAAVWGSAQPDAVGWLAGNYVVNPAVNGIFLNVGDYRSFGYRSAYTQRIGSRVETTVAYFVGGSMYARGATDRPSEGNVQSMFKPVRSMSLAERVSARIPVTETQVITSYEWVQCGRVTMVDPYGQADLQLQPFFDVQIRQPLPALAFLPAHIEAVADFRNLFGQGYSPLVQSGERPLLLGPAYRSVRGGISVQF